MALASGHGAGNHGPPGRTWNGAQYEERLCAPYRVFLRRSAATRAPEATPRRPFSSPFATEIEAQVDWFTYSFPGLVLDHYDRVSLFVVARKALRRFMQANEVSIGT